MKSPKYTRQHYIDIAGLISKIEIFERAKQANEFVKKFAADNPAFDKEKFLKACGL